jgi:hypothetical protein
MSTPFRCHWNESGGLPLAVTLNVTDRPMVTDWLVGCVVIVGA